MRGSSGGGPRPWLAALLGLVLTGLGHAYLRRWKRALGWLATAMVASVLFVSPETAQAVVEGSQGAANPVDLLPVLVVSLLSVVDAYALARSERRGRADAAAGEAGPAGASAAASAPPTGEEEGDRPARPPSGSQTDCVHCGRELDADVDFCPWCGAEEPRTPDEDGGSLLS